MTINPEVLSEARNPSRFVQFLKDHYEEMLALVFFVGAATMAVLTCLGLVVIAI